MKTVDDIIAEFEPRQIAVTFDRDDLYTLHAILTNGYTNLDKSGIIAHILDELGVDLFPNNGV